MAGRRRGGGIIRAGCRWARCRFGDGVGEGRAWRWGIRRGSGRNRRGRRVSGGRGWWFGGLVCCLGRVALPLCGMGWWVWWMDEACYVEDMAGKGV